MGGLCSWNSLKHWGRVTHICVSKPTTIGSDNGLSPDWRQAIIRTNAGILLTGPLETSGSEMSIKIQTFSLKKIRLKMLPVNCCLFRLGLHVLKRKADCPWALTAGASFIMYTVIEPDCHHHPWIPYRSSNNVYHHLRQLERLEEMWRKTNT